MRVGVPGRPPVITRSIRSTEPEPWTFDAEAVRVAHEARPRRSPRGVARAIGRGLDAVARALCWLLIVGSIVVMLVGAVAAFAGCSSSSQAQAMTAETVARTATAGGLAIARWEVEHTDCGKLADDECLEKLRGMRRELWDAWDAFVLLHHLYAGAIERGDDGPTFEEVLAAYCAVVPLLPADAPVELLVPGACP